MVSETNSMASRKRSIKEREWNEDDEEIDSADDLPDAAETGSSASGSASVSENRSETPLSNNLSSSRPNQGRKGKQAGGRKKAGMVGSSGRNPNFNYKCVGYWKEDHGQPIFGVSVNHHLGPDQPTVFATVGNNRVTIYEAMQSGDNRFVIIYYLLVKLLGYLSSHINTVVEIDLKLFSTLDCFNVSLIPMQTKVSTLVHGHTIQTMENQFLQLLDQEESFDYSARLP